MKKLLFVILMFITLVSCEKALMDKNPSDSPIENFESLWNTVNTKYSYFELKNISWDSVYSYYSPQVTEGTTDEELFSILGEMLYDLRDGHVNLISPFDVSRNWEWYLNYPVNFNYDVIQRNYLADDYRIAGGMQYTIIDSIGYIYYSSFSSGFSVNNLNQVVGYMKDTKGLIIDVRNNGGGSLNSALVLSQRFINSKKEVLVSFEKTGPDHDDFGNGLSYLLGPSDKINYQGKIALLTNRKCYSATNTFVAIMSQFDNITIIGDRTGGGGGIPVDYELPNGWRYRFSATRSFIPTPAGYLDIETGVPNDINASTGPADWNLGVDNIIETALTFLN